MSKTDINYFIGSQKVYENIKKKSSDKNIDLQVNSFDYEVFACVDFGKRPNTGDNRLNNMGVNNDGDILFI